MDCMKYRKNQISEENRFRVANLLKENISKEPILFAYLFGSFVTNQKFNDIDVAVFVDVNKISEKSLFKYEVALEQRLADILNEYAIDVRVLNNAPISFKYQVIKNSSPIYVYDEDAMVDFEVLTYSMYFDFAALRKEYLKEVLGAKV